MIDNYNKKQLFEKRVFSKLNRGKHSNRSSYFNINKDMLTSKTKCKLKSLDNVTLKKLIHKADTQLLTLYIDCCLGILRSFIAPYKKHARR